MSKRRVFSFGLIVMGAILVCAAESSAEERRSGEPVNGLQALLSLPDPKIASGADLLLHLEVRNVSNTSLSVYKKLSELLGMPGYAKFIVRKADGTMVKISQRIDMHSLPPPEHYVRLDPGTSLKRNFMMLTEAYNEDSGKYKPLLPGVYEVLVEVTFSDEGHRVGVQDAWVGTVTSNPVRFEVIDESSTAKGYLPGRPMNGLTALLTLPDGRIAEGVDLLLVNLELQNVSNDSLSIFRDISGGLSSPGQVRFLVNKVGGGSVRVSHPEERFAFSWPEHYVRLDPGKSFKKRLEMETWYREPESKDAQRLMPGTYEVQLEFTFPADEGGRAGVKDAWAGTVISNPVRFEIMKVPQAD